MATNAFLTPQEALDAVVSCLAPPTKAVVHTGSGGTGTVIPCCRDSVDGVLRVETGETQPASGAPQAFIPNGKCVQFVQEIQVVWRTCMNTNTGKTAPSTEWLTENGQAIISHWWSALQALMNCSTSQNNQRFRFVSRVDDPPEGGCAGYTLTIECDIGLCK